MKNQVLAVFLAFLAMATVKLRAGTEAPATNAVFTIASPDHPETWEVGFNDKVGQSLRWSDGEGMLYLDVTYSRITYNDTISAANFKTYTLAFPGVMSDAENRLYVFNSRKQKIFIGSLAGSPFGLRVALKDGARLEARRKHGQLDGVLVIVGARWGNV